MQLCQSALPFLMLSPNPVVLHAQKSGQQLPLWHAASGMVNPDQHDTVVSLNIEHQLCKSACWQVSAQLYAACHSTMDGEALIEC